MSLITNKPKAIIYCAENLISGKKYVGRTIRSLEARIKEHFSKTIKRNHKFANALKCYPKDSWKFYVLAEVEYEKANEYELFFIADLNTYDNGYNTLNTSYLGEGKSNINYNSKIYHLYHFEYGEVLGTRSELVNKYPELVRIDKLVNNTRNQINGWVLFENKENYEKITKNKTKIGRYCESVTLTHKKHGTFTLKQSQFETQFDLRSSAISLLKSGKQKLHKGWKLVDTDN